MMTERRPGSLHQAYGEVDVEARVDLAGTEGHVRAEARAGGGGSKAWCVPGQSLVAALGVCC
ncbi:hypothetical protein ES288_D03G054300v1 [Gossypium darwinii]|uniref:Uncharacterized protein n=1 Tax=Gossypium darwinii TaxID=34276 RepID=A0A5D2D509_GOSDA|nr:hypothetical protein ES288_D03G054300v1 [Gossypium darwinii]